MSKGSWNCIDKFFKENQEIRSIFEEVSSECISDGCYSLPIIYVKTLERLIEEWDNL